MTAAAVMEQEAERLAALESNGSVAHAGTDIAGVDTRELPARGADPLAPATKRHGAVQVGIATAIERIALFGSA